eukprot:2964209-Rhodomonas_salina.2
MSLSSRRCCWYRHTLCQYRTFRSRRVGRQVALVSSYSKWKYRASRSGRYVSTGHCIAGSSAKSKTSDHVPDTNRTGQWNGHRNAEHDNRCQYRTSRSTTAYLSIGHCIANV